MSSLAAMQIPPDTSATPSRILDLRDSPWVDGPGRTILDTAEMISSSDFEIVIGAFSGAKHGEHAYLTEAERRGLRTWPITETRALDFKVLSSIIKWCRLNAVRLLHTHDFRSDLYGLAAARYLRLPIVSTCHGWIANDLKGRTYTLVDKYLQRYFNRVIVVSNKMRSELVSHGVTESKITVIHNALILECYHSDPNDRRVKTEWNIPADHKLIVNIGRLSPEKCQDNFLRAAAKVLRQHPNSYFALIGIGPDQDKLKTLATELDINEKVIFAGYRSDMQAIYNSADLVVQSSSTEGMPNVILEALLMHVPVIATDVGGTGEIVTHDHTGVLIAPNDIDALANAILRFMSNPDVFNTMADAGAVQIQSNFSHTARLQRIAEVYGSVLKERG